MKKVISIFLSVVMLLSAFSSFAFTANAGDKNYEYRVDYTSSNGEFLYYIKEDDTVVIKKYLGTNEEVIIPESLNGCPVSELYFYCFTDCDTVKNVVYLGDKVKQDIGNSAFYNCKNLEQITFSNRVSVIFPRAFFGCSKLTKICFMGTKKQFNKIKLYSDGNDVLDSVTVNYKNYFKIGVDNNNFVHSGDKRYLDAGFVNRNDYSLSDEYKNKLLSKISDGERDHFIKENIKAEWKGSCYGVAATMGLAYMGELPEVNDRFSTGITGKYGSYYGMGRPCDNDSLDNVIQYYHLAGKISKYSKYKKSYFSKSHIRSSIASKNSNFSSLPEFFSSLLKTVDEKGIAQFIYSYKNTKQHLFKLTQHSVLVLEYYKLSDGSYLIKLYDENSYDDYYNNGHFDTIKLSSDMKSFEWLGKVLNEDTFYQLAYYDLDNYLKVDNQKISTFNSSNLSNNKYSVIIPSNCEFQLIDENNKTLVYKDGEFSGDKEIYSLDFIGDSSLDNETESSEIIIEFEGSPIFTFVPLSENAKIDVHNDINYIGFEGSDVDSAKFDLNNCLEITGGTGDFDGYISKLDENDIAVYSVSGQQCNNIKMYYDNSNVALKSNGNINSLKVERLDLDGSKSLLENLSADNLLIDNEDTIYSDEVIVSCQHKKIENGKCVKCGEEVSTGGNTGGSTGGGGAAPAPEPTTDETQKDDEKRPELKPDQTQNNSTSATKKLSIKKLISKKKEFTVYWNKITDVSGYQIQVATDKKFKKNKKTFTIKKQNVSKKTVKKLKAKKKYFVRIRAYSVVNGKKVYGKWSKIQSAKTK